MVKKIIGFGLLLVLVFSVCACGNDKNPEKELLKYQTQAYDTLSEFISNFENDYYTSDDWQLMSDHRASTNTKIFSLKCKDAIDAAVEDAISDILAIKTIPQYKTEAINFLLEYAEIKMGNNGENYNLSNGLEVLRIVADATLQIGELDCSSLYSLDYLLLTIVSEIDSVTTVADSYAQWLARYDLALWWGYDCCFSDFVDILLGNTKIFMHDDEIMGLGSYQIYCLYHPEYQDDQREWMDDLVEGRLGDGRSVCGLSKLFEDSIRQDYFNYRGGLSNLSDVIFRKYYGTYNDIAVAVMMDSKESVLWGDYIVEDVVEGFKFVYTSNSFYDSILIWCLGDFMNLQEAYDEGYISLSDLQKIHQLQSFVL